MRYWAPLLIVFIILLDGRALGRPYNEVLDNLFFRIRGCSAVHYYSPTPWVDAGVVEKAKRGDAKAQETLGEAYASGYTKGIKQDYKEAAKWFRKSSEQGHHPWQLAKLYLAGKGVKQNYAEAYYWAMLEMLNSESPNCEAIVILDDAARHLSFAEISQVNARLGKWHLPLASVKQKL